MQPRMGRSTECAATVGCSTRDCPRFCSQNPTDPTPSASCQVVLRHVVDDVLDLTRSLVDTEVQLVNLVPPRMLVVGDSGRIVQVGTGGAHGVRWDRRGRGRHDGVGAARWRGGAAAHAGGGGLGAHRAGGDGRGAWGAVGPEGQGKARRRRGSKMEGRCRRACWWWGTRGASCRWGREGRMGCGGTGGAGEGTTA